MNQTPYIQEITLQNFQSDVVERSGQLPVLVEFYAPGAEPSEQLAPVLRQLAESYGGKFLLARVNIQESQQLVQQLRIRTLPTLILVSEGQMVQQLEGPQQETSLRELLDQATMSPVEQIREQITLLLSGGDRVGAIQLLRQIIQEEPSNHGLQTELCDLLILEDRLDEAKQLLASLPEDAEGIGRPRNRLEFMEEAGGLGSREEWEKKLMEAPQNAEIQYQLAVIQMASDDAEAALGQLLNLLQQDREFGEDLARKTMIRIFDLLGKGNSLATEYRRKMFTYLH